VPLSFNGLVLQPFAYFIYSIHTGASGFVSIDDLGEIPSLHAVTSQQNWSMKTKAPLPAPITAPNDLRNAPASGPTAINLTTNYDQPPTYCQRAVITEVMEKVWGIFPPREFQVEAVARLVSEPKTCLFLIQKI
jgi:hypothetical protein